MRRLMVCGFMALLGLVFLNGTGSAESVLLKQIEQEFVLLHQKVGPVVVNIETQGEATGMDRGQMEDIFRFFGVPMPEEGPRGRSPIPRPRGTGSGLILDKEGHIVTNNHVVESATKITVKLWNGNEYDAKIIGRDPEGDLAVVKIEAKEDLPVAQLGDSDTLQVGQFAIAIGSARGFEGTVSFGHVTALGREGLEALAVQGLTFQNLIQTDAAINLGNSGGPLCNSDGEVIGINTAIVWGANNIGFAIPVNQAKDILPQLIAYGKVSRGYLGVAIDDAREFADSLGLPDTSGAFVKRVQPDTPAERAEMQTYDVIRKVDGKAVKDAADLVRRISSYPPGSEVKLEIWRNGETLELTVHLEERNLLAEAAKLEEDIFGLRVRELSPEILERMGLSPETSGVLVTSVEPGSPAEDARLINGDIITEVAQQPVRSVDGFLKLVEENGQPGKSLLIKFQRGNNDPDITVIRIPEE